MGTHGSPIPYPSLGSVSLPIGAHNPISANGSYVPALPETIGCLRGTIVPSNWGGKHDWLFPDTIQEGSGWAPKALSLLGCRAGGLSLPLLPQFSFTSVLSDSLQPHGLQHTHSPVHHQLPELAQTHVRRVSDAIHHLILCRPLLPQRLPFPTFRDNPSLGHLPTAPARLLAEAFLASLLPPSKDRPKDSCLVHSS